MTKKNVTKLILFTCCLLLPFTSYSSNFSPKTTKDGLLTSPAIDLIVPQRADVLAKYIYAKLRDWETKSKFGEEIYFHHLKVWNNFFEGEPPKRTFDDFVNSFNCVLDSIKKDGFDFKNSLVPIDTSGRIVNGAHRLTACALYHQDVYLDCNPDYHCPDWNLEYFKLIGLEEKYLDAMAIQYCALKPSTYMLTVFPSAIGKDKEIEEILSRNGEIIYKKIINLTFEGGFNFILQAYADDPFVQQGSRNNYLDAKAKALLCFPRHLVGTSPLRTYLFECDSLERVKKCKDAIRKIYNISNHSIHSTDTHKDTLNIAKTLFNKNSIHFLNYRKEAGYVKFNCFFNNYKKWIEHTIKQDEWVIVDGSAILSAYGLRDCNDLDFIHFDDSCMNSPSCDISSHNHELQYHAFDKDDLLFDPDNFFYYKGLKFCSLKVLKAMKLKRHEPKDINDVILIDSIPLNSSMNQQVKPGCFGTVQMENFVMNQL